MGKKGEKMTKSRYPYMFRGQISHVRWALDLHIYLLYVSK